MTATIMDAALIVDRRIRMLTGLGVSMKGLSLHDRKVYFLHIHFDAALDWAGADADAYAYEDDAADA